MAAKFNCSFQYSLSIEIIFFTKPGGWFKTPLLPSFKVQNSAVFHCVMWFHMMYCIMLMCKGYSHLGWAYVRPLTWPVVRFWLVKLVSVVVGLVSHWTLRCKRALQLHFLFCINRMWELALRGCSVTSMQASQKASHMAVLFHMGHIITLIMVSSFLCWANVEGNVMAFTCSISCCDVTRNWLLLHILPHHSI